MARKGDGGRIGKARTLAVDIGGSGIKALILDRQGAPATERQRLETPSPSTPLAIIETITELARGAGRFDRVSVGFPGIVRRGIVLTAPNLDPSWQDVNLEGLLTSALERPVRAANDADVQGFGAIQGRGVELVLTLGTGFGSALFVDGTLVPNLELAHHPFHKNKTYEERLGQAALKKSGRKRWNRTLARAIATLRDLFSYDMLYVGGGNAKKITLELDQNVRLVPNVAGLYGGFALWT